MSKAKHTPAPWREFDGDIVSLSDVYGNIVCSAPFGLTESMKWWDENARLICKAPEMLEMLQSVVDLQANHYGNGIDTHLALTQKAAEIRELIKSIEG